jgi:hypothetical protein
MTSSSLIDSATQWIINAHYNQRLFSVRDLTTKYEAYTCLALPAFGARTFSTVITTSVIQELNEKIAGVDCMMR